MEDDFKKTNSNRKSQLVLNKFHKNTRNTTFYRTFSTSGTQHYKNEKTEEQAGAELCQAQVQLGRDLSNYKFIISRNLHHLQLKPFLLLV